VTGPLPSIRGRQLLRALARDSWFIARTGAHHILRHPSKPGRLIVPNHPSETVKEGTLRSILNQAGLSIDEFRALI